MKKIFALLMVLCAMALGARAQVAFLLRTDISNLPAENYNSVDQQPEKNAANWFKDDFSSSNKAMLSINQVKEGCLLDGGVPAYKVLWVNVDTKGAVRLADPVFGSDVTDKIKEYVQAGGNLLLTKQASHIICKIGRMKYNDNTDYEPGWVATDYTVGGDIWSINAIMGQNLTKRDARQHPIFNGMSVVGEGNDERFPLIGAVARTDNNIMWNDIYRKDKERIGNDNDIQQMREFERDWNCQMLAVWGQVVNYCAPTVIEFFPDATYKGSIIAIGAAAYQWGTSNNYISNVQKLTENALNYLSQGGSMYGYYMPYTLSELYSLDGEDGTYKPDYEAAKWFYENYVTAGIGRFIHKEESIPTDMKVLWVNNDRSSYTDRVTYYNDCGGSDFKTKLENYVKAGGKLFLSKQATRLANDIGRISVAPDYRYNGWTGKDDAARYMTADLYALKDAYENRVGHDRHNHPVYKYLPAEAWVTHNEQGQDVYCKWQLMDFTDANKRTDNNSIWENQWDGYADAVHLARATKFENDHHCAILGGYGHTTALDGAGFVEFGPYGDYQGTVIALGLHAYQWGTNNGLVSNVQYLTQGVLEYLYNADIYTRTVPADHYGTICLPRASAAIEGATIYRVLSEQTDGIMLEEVNSMTAGVPYFFYASDSEIRVTMTGAAVDAPLDGNGLVGNFGPENMIVPNETDNYILGSDNTLYFVDAGNIVVGANRAYLDRSAIAESAPVAGMPKRKMNIHLAPDAATAIKMNDATDGKPVKMMINGHLYVGRDGKLYDATGARVK